VGGTARLLDVESRRNYFSLSSSSSSQRARDLMMMAGGQRASGADKWCPGRSRAYLGGLPASHDRPRHTCRRHTGTHTHTHTPAIHYIQVSLLSETRRRVWHARDKTRHFMPASDVRRLENVNYWLFHQ